ncbi:MAG: tryptophan--tRNA ligase [Nitrospirae bacterium 13_1_20CM_4_62_6]|nr:MAG: tryptophan--tRNA ligase [Nitrospirae bacterium 13_1_20CM_4_62_6]
MSPPARKRVLSGMQPSGLLHLGNLLGALDNWKALQEKYECFFFVADWHAISTNYADTSRIKEFTRELLIDWLAAGIDPQRAAVFIQSRNPDHAILHLLLSMIVPVPWLERNPTYKEKQEEIKDRDLSTYGLHLTQFPKVLGTDGRKMSKSYGNTINLSDAEPVVRQKLKTMVTDPARVKRTDPGNPDVCPVYDFHKIFSPAAVIERVNRECRTAEIGCIDCKKLVADAMVERLTPIWDERNKLTAKPDRVEEIVREGGKRAAAVSHGTLEEVKAAMNI